MHGLSSQWLFVTQTVLSVDDFTTDTIHQVFISALTGCPPSSENLWLVYALPVLWVGIGIFVSTNGCVYEFAASHHLSVTVFITTH